MIDRLRKASLAGLALASAGLVGVVASAVRDPLHALHAWLAAFGAGLAAVLAMLVLVMCLHVARARWWLVLRPLTAGVTGALPLFVVLFLPVVLGLRRLYPWARPVAELGDLPEAVLRALDHQRAWNSAPFFLVRAALYFIAWLALWALLARADAVTARAPTSSRPERFERQRTVSGAGLPILAFTITFAAFDWLMSVEPGWIANAYGLYVFTGGLSSAVALLAILVWVAEGTSRAPRAFGPAHVHAVGRLLLMAVILWAYIGFFQLMLVWIADIPRESSFYGARARGPWIAVDVLLVAAHFVVPFFALLSRRLKRSAAGLASVGVMVLAASALDVVWLVLPAAGGPRLLDVCPFAVVYGLLVAVGVRRAAHVSAAARGGADVDPVLRASSEYASP